MQIKLRLPQALLKLAVHQYIENQGDINLAGKSVEIEFTATRGDDGIVADVTIEKALPPSAVVAATVTAPAQAHTADVSKEAAQADTPFEPDAPAETKEVAAASEDKAASAGVSSLFSKQ